MTEVVRIISVYGPQSGIMGAEKDLRSEWDLHSVGELVLGIGDFNGHVDGLRVMRVCMEEMELGIEIWKERCSWNFVMKRSCV